MPRKQAKDGTLLWQTPVARLAFPALFKPKQRDVAKRPDYSATLLFEKATFLDKVEHEVAVELLKEKAKVTFGDTIPLPLREEIKRQYSDIGTETGQIRVFRDGDYKLQPESGELYEGFAGHIYMTARTSIAPSIRDEHGNPLVGGEADLYAGCFVRAILIPWANVPKQKGHKYSVKFILSAIQKVADGERLGGKFADYSEFLTSVESTPDLPADGTGRYSPEDLGY